LTGAHVSTQCASCHVNNNYQLVYTDCYQCHATDFTGATNPNHLTGNFSHDCTQCHSTTLWQPATFNHASTPFPLTGAHLTATCQSCHVNGNYQLHYTDCYQCHATDFAGATNPNHVTGNFSHDCTQCHSTTLWQPATFNHASTPFPLTGAHLTATCQSCHVNGNYQLHYTDCYACHQTQFAQPTNPNHVLGNFGHNCTPCHTTSVWRPSTFSHNNTPFPLTGAHQAVACNSCHVNNQYQNIPTACYDCHMADFNGTTNPNHVTGNFSHDCTQCHNTAGWSPATFNHAQTLFPLTGAHTSVQCQTCHVNGNYQLHYTDCYQCHQSDYAGVANPNHVTQAFSHNCTPCHSTSVWTPNTMSHDSRWFRIYTGEHRGRWSQCTQCHPVPGNLPNFSCMTGNCHPQAQTNSEHNGRPGYVYQASACYSCHRNV
jgi:nitrate/TMAO reductase-like tetraheme cytochrome c subunit